MKTQNYLSRFHNSERASAMTEFVIGLPVFILIFAGMGGIYKLNHEAIGAKGRVNATLWAEASPGAPGLAGMVPVLGVGSISSWGDLAANGGSLLGIYADSYVKTLIPLTALGAVATTRPTTGCFTLDCPQIGMADNLFARPLLDDNIVSAVGSSDFDFSGWAAGISTVLSIAGSRPAVAAGIRYGAVRSESVGRTVSLPMWGNYSFETGDLQVPGITDPTHRIFAVALTRLEFATKDVWHSQIPEFNDEWTFESGEAPSQESGCQEAVSTHEACMANPPLDPDTGEPDPGQCDANFEGGGACAEANKVPGLGDLQTTWCKPGIPGCKYDL